LDRAVKAIFTSEISKEKGFKEFIEGLHKESERVFEAFAKEDADNLAGLKTELLPKVNTNQKLGVNALLSAILYHGFHERVMAAVPEADRGFVPSTLSEDLFLSSSSKININFSRLLDDKFLDLYKKKMTGVFPSGLAVFTEKSAENRLKKNATFYETPSNEFNETQQKELETIYQEAKQTIINKTSTFSHWIPSL